MPYEDSQFLADLALKLRAVAEESEILPGRQFLIGTVPFSFDDIDRLERLSGDLGEPA